MTCLTQNVSAAYVIGRDDFRKNGHKADIGNYAFGFEWAAWACFLIASILYCVGGGSSSRKEKTYGSTKRSFFKRNKSTKSTRSRGSFIDGDRKTYESA